MSTPARSRRNLTSSDSPPLAHRPAALTWLAHWDAGRQQGTAQAEASGNEQQAPRPHCPEAARAAGRPRSPASFGAVRSDLTGDQRRLRGRAEEYLEAVRGRGAGPRGLARARSLRSRPQPVAPGRERPDRCLDPR